MGKENSNVLGKAFEEFQRVLAGAPPPSTPKLTTSILAANEGSETIQPEAEKGPMTIKKGANQKGKRNALGRGLSALMTSNTLEVHYPDPATQRGPAQVRTIGTNDSASTESTSVPAQGSAATLPENAAGVKAPTLKKEWQPAEDTQASAPQEQLLQANRSQNDTSGPQESSKQLGGRNEKSGLVAETMPKSTSSITLSADVASEAAQSSDSQKNSESLVPGSQIPESQSSGSQPKYWVNSTESNAPPAQNASFASAQTVAPGAVTHRTPASIFEVLGSNTATETPTEEVVLDRSEGLYEVPITALIANPKQPRQFFSDEEIDELSQSLLHSGILQPILVRLAAQSGAVGSSAARYEIIAGERRYRAARKAGLTRVPVLVRDLDDREVLEVSIVENVQRSQLNAVEEAQAYARLQQEFGLSQEEVAKIVGKDRATITNSLRLLKLSEKVHDMMIAGQLSAGHARALLMLENKAAQEKVAQQIVNKLLSVRAAEQLVRDSRQESGRSKAARSGTTGTGAELSGNALQRSSLEERFRRALGTKVQLRLNSRGAGELRISFFSQEELEKLLETIDA